MVYHMQECWLRRGIHVTLIGGELKGSTEAVIGSFALQMLQMYHFTRGFFGTNGVTKHEGFTTPDASEALVKRKAWSSAEKPMYSVMLQNSVRSVL